jgi:alpha-1,6-mannosyltransferase
MSFLSFAIFAYKIRCKIKFFLVQIDRKLGFLLIQFNLMLKSSIFNDVIRTVGILLFAALLALMGYFTQREQFVLFIAEYLGAFLVFYLLWKNLPQNKTTLLFVLAFAFRFVLFYATPELSNDFYRFLWDGELLMKGINPFAHTPNELISQLGFIDQANMRNLFHGMGELSQGHYSCYPVLNQLLFFIPALLTDDISLAIMILKGIIILADLGVIWVAIKIAKLLEVNIHNVWLYALNPFIILEFSGNLHFEGVMIFFLLLAIYFVLSYQWIYAGLFLGLAIQIKLIPFMLLPFFYKKLGFVRALGFTAMTLFTVLLIGGLMLNNTYLNNMLLSINEYFIRFEFNASIFYIVRAIGFAVNDYDPILTAGPILSKIAAILILFLAIFKAVRNDLDMVKGMLFAFVIYYAFATTVHPWYISLVLILSIFTTYKFGIVWSIVIMLSYYAYSNPIHQEHPVFIIAEYFMVYAVLIYEVYQSWSKGLIAVQYKEFFKK